MNFIAPPSSCTFLGSDRIRFIELHSHNINNATRSRKLVSSFIKKFNWIFHELIFRNCMHSRNVTRAQSAITT